MFENIESRAEIIERIFRPEQEVALPSGAKLYSRVLKKSATLAEVIGALGGE